MDGDVGAVDPEAAVVLLEDQMIGTQAFDDALQPEPARQPRQAQQIGIGLQNCRAASRSLPRARLDPIPHTSSGVP
jgi:hypothetical protein